jgi:hypothetical protein
MNELIWEPYINEISRMQGQKAKTNILMFKILASRHSVELRVYKSYCGELVRILNFEDVNQAVSIAEELHKNCLSGWDIHELLKS